MAREKVAKGAYSNIERQQVSEDIDFFDVDSVGREGDVLAKFRDTNSKSTRNIQKQDNPTGGLGKTASL